MKELPTSPSKIRVKRSSIQGKGVFADGIINKGELICFMLGKQVSMKEYEQMYKGGNKRLGADPLQIGVRTYISLHNPYNLINHSCEPNAAIKGINQLRATRKIQKGEEITYDYSSVEWTPQEYPPYYAAHWPMKCNCKKQLCRKMIGCFGYLPKPLQEKYIKSGSIQNHILRKLKWTRSKQKCFICEKKLGIKLK